MPHLHDNSEAEEKVLESHTRKLPAEGPANAASTPPARTVKEAREGSLSASGRQVSASPDSSVPPAQKIPSFESAEEERTPEDTSSPPSHPPKQIITPSPYGMNRAPTPENRFGPMVSIYGSTRLFPSPIRVKKRSNNTGSDSERNSPSPQMIQPSNLRYAGAFATPPPTRPELKRMLSTDSASSRGKRPVDHIVIEESKKKSKVERTDTSGYGFAESGSMDDERGRRSPGDHIMSSTKKPIISPTSSGEKGEDDSTAPHARRHSYGGRPYMHGYPPYPSHYPYGAPHSYPGAYHHMFSTYPPPPPQFMAGHPPYYPPYPPHPHAMAPHYRTHGKNAFTEAQYRAGAPKSMGMAPAMSSDSAEGTDPAIDATRGSNSAIKSVADWQQAALSTGKPPSAGRCLPLKEPIPSRYWGEAEKTKDVVLPDFHRLVNYPDYLAKSRSPSSTDSGAPPSGKKNCVMCGKLRVCSASSLVNKNKAKHDDVASSLEDDGTAHIIPRQNKGLCTACDVTVWVVVSDGLEIKWCKGCKNFRPWAAFGDKGSATKCVRCRDRQREKYAMQKDEIRLRRYKRSSSPSGSSPSAMGEVDATGARKWDENRDEDTHLAAARGLRNLMNATSSV